jgi:hypothetical protein
MRFQLASDGIKISRRKKSNDEITDIWRIWSRWPGMRRVIETIHQGLQSDEDESVISQLLGFPLSSIQALQPALP